MPRATNRYGFEWRALAWAHAHAGGAGFFAHFDAAGKIEETVVAAEPERCVAASLAEQLQARHERWIFFDPFDLPEYQWLSWQQLKRAWLERLLGQPLTASDLLDRRDGSQLADFPERWGVMF